MKISPAHALAAAAAIVAAAVLGQVLVPQDSMAISPEAFDLEKVVPQQFGAWKSDPSIRLIEPPAPDSMARRLYSQEIARAYRDADGHLVMFLVAYGPNQTSRLQLHRPEICYTAEGFRVSPSSRQDVLYDNAAAPLRLLRLTARRAARTEPISYWVRIGDEISTNIVDRQLIRLKLALRGKIADGALMRVSTLSPGENDTGDAYKVQDRFIHDFFEALAPENRSFFFGGQRSYPMQARR
jgi:EpsI family protein